MRRFIIKSILVAMSWLLPLYILQAVYDHAAHQVYNKWPYNIINTAFDSPQNASLIILGNSRGKDNYIPEILDSVLEMKCCNLSLSGYTFDFTYNMVFLPYMKNNVAPRYIIQDVAPWAFFEDVNPPYRIEFLPYINRPELSFYIDRCEELSLLDKYLPLKYHGQMSDYFENLWSFWTNEQEPPVRNYYLKDYFWAEDYRPLEKDPDKLELFSRYLKDCKDNQIKVVLVCSPTHTEDGFSHFDMKGFRELVDSIAKIEGIPFLDYSEFYGADTLYFIDPVHLKKDARRIYCEKIAEDLKTMGWTLNE